MIFKCRNCGGNSVFSPEKQEMFCPYCESENSADKKGETKVNLCSNCGAELSIGENIMACKCDSCDSYLIFEERMTGEFAPHLVLPFKIGKETSKKILRTEFGSRMFIPSDFLTDAKLEKLEGIYVPYFMFDFDCNYKFVGKALKIREWSSGNTDYRETSYYNVEREIDVRFSKIPVDASDTLDDRNMDLIEPYNYYGLINFEEKYLSGFIGEKFHHPIMDYMERAKAKAFVDAETMMQREASTPANNYNMSANVAMAMASGAFSNASYRYDVVEPINKDVKFDYLEGNYALLPIWSYLYQYGDKKYQYFINGQTGKLVGEVPISVKKVVSYSTTLFVGLSFISLLLALIMEVF